jgi:DNA replication and repair protein RecF
MLKKLKLFNFRNFSEVDIDFIDNLNIFVGQNAQGKTNLLEAIYLLSNGSSFRSSLNEHFVKTENSNGAVHGITDHNQQKNKISLKVEHNNKSILINEKKTNSTQTKKIFPTVLFSPESLELIKGSGENRRNLVDEIIYSIFPEKFKIVNDFKKVLKSRNQILKDLSQEINPTKLQVLDGLNQIFLEQATLLTELRIKAITELKSELTNTARSLFTTDEITGSVDISVEYVISGSKVSGFSNNQIKSLMLDRMEQLKSAEISRGLSLVGPQKHDVIIYLNEKDSRYYCSQGQQRALILSIKMAQVVYHEKKNGKPPVLLLDDVLSELDTQRQNALITFLKSIKSQAFITTTDNSLSHQFDKSGFKLMKVTQGSVKSEDSKI